MIFRLDGNVPELLAMTPVIREWKRRYKKPVIVETFTPEIFEHNPDVDMAGWGFVRADHSVMNFNLVEWHKNPQPVSKTFALWALEDSNMQCWRTVMGNSDEDETRAAEAMPDGMHVAVIDSSAPMSGAIDELMHLGYSIVIAGVEKGYGVFRAIVNSSEMYVGVDSDNSAVALTTNTPSVICYHYRNPVYFKPFRRGVPWQPVRVRQDVCGSADGCMVSNALTEFGKLYGINCTNEKEFCCYNSHSRGDVVEAIHKIDDWIHYIGEINQSRSV